MKASEIPFEVGDMVTHTTDWGEEEWGIVVEIPNGEEIDSIEIAYEDGSYGEERPQDWTLLRKNPTPKLRPTQ